MNDTLVDAHPTLSDGGSEPIADLFLKGSVGLKIKLLLAFYSVANFYQPNERRSDA